MAPPDPQDDPTQLPPVEEPSFSLRGRTNERLGDYHLLRKLGQGGMGEVFLAKRLRVGGFEKTLAIKRMLDSLSGSTEFVAMFLDEARLAARLDHSNIAQIFDFGFADGHYYIALEHIPGEDVSAIVTRLNERGQLLPVEIGVRIVMDVCAGLQYAHTLSDQGQHLGIIHRDVSPSNIMVSYQGAVKLLDFGIAKATSRATATRTGNIKGKFLFVSPEQVRGESIDARVDLFALGITMFSLLTGQHPYRRDNDLATMHAIAQADAPDVRTFRPELSEEVAAVVRKAMARDQNQRYQTAAEMGEALQAVLNQSAPGTGPTQIARVLLDLFGPVRRDSKIEVPAISQLALAAVATPLPGAEGTDDGLATKSLVLPPGDRAKPRSRFRGPLLMIVGWAVAGVLGGALFAGLRRHDGPPEGPPPPSGTVAQTPGAPSEPSRATGPSAGSPTGSPSSLAPDSLPSAVLAPGRPRNVTTTKSSRATPGGAPGKSSPSRSSAPKGQSPSLAVLDRNSLDVVIKGARQKFAGCFRTHAAQLPNESGQVRIEIAVLASGRVASTKVLALPANAVGLIACLDETSRQLRFPRHSDQEVRFAFPLLYRRGE